METNDNFDDSSEGEDIIDERELTLTPYQVDWVDLMCPGAGQVVGLGALPGCQFKDTRRMLSRDIATLKTTGVERVVVLCTIGELRKYRVPSLMDAFTEAGIEVYHHPFADGSVPELEQMMNIIAELTKALQEGSRVLIHCFGGLGRTGIVAVCLLLHLNPALTSEAAIDMIRELRGPRAIQTVKQYNFVNEFRNLRDDFLEKRSVRCDSAQSRSISR